MNDRIREAFAAVHAEEALKESTRAFVAERTAGLSLGKYRMYQALQALDPAITAEEVRDMTMSQLQALLDALSGGGGTSGTQSAGQGGGQGAGQTGTGQGAGQSGHHGYGHSGEHDE